MPVLTLDFTDFERWWLHCPACGSGVLSDGQDQVTVCGHLRLHYQLGQGVQFLSPGLEAQLGQTPSPERLRVPFETRPSWILFQLRVVLPQSPTTGEHWLGFDLREVWVPADTGEDSAY